jgi:Fe-S oxidoreductase
MGLVDKWSRLAAFAPGLANLATQTPGLAAIARWAGGISPERELPAFAPMTFRRWFARHESAVAGDAPTVVLWPDTFTNYLHTDVAIAAVEVLEAVGYRVVVPARALCCGRPLYDYGMLDRARAYLTDVLDALAPHLHAGTPIVVLEPSCASVFRDEGPNLMSRDVAATRLAGQTQLLGEFLRAHDVQLPRLERHAIVHGHCHQKALFDLDHDRELLESVGLTLDVLSEAGCCGMAGSFGYERDKYDVSIACGEHVLLPKIRSASLESLIIVDGFSCREQIAQGTQRHGLHLAQVLQLALHHGAGGPSSLPAESAVIAARERGQRRSMVRAARGLAAAGVLAAALFAIRR